MVVDRKEAFATQSSDVKLSKIGALYDIDGDGKLDKEEQAMRDMDKSGRGFLTNDKVYTLMQEHFAMERKFMRSKRVIFGLVALVILLCLSNLGTSIAAAYLSKDTKTSAESNLIDKRTGEAVGTETIAESLELRRVTRPDSEGRRRLCTTDGGELDCDVEESTLLLDTRACRRVLRRCKKGQGVNLVLKLSSGMEDSTSICPLSNGQVSATRRSSFKNSNNDEIVITPVDDGCEIGGLVRDEGKFCDVSAECRGDLLCSSDSEEDVKMCQGRCGRLRFASFMRDVCQDECAQKKCTKATDEVGALIR
ncbi:hypothetical protein THAOC_04051 [Thalassiosira oceanica]|uniref:Uncharacterized protein n=2 Tax=Thalassiosira oceanica TaxID=159749 RepID=K0T9U6_THAOC|nr:hypothetical protein THAOC_04051 [Thalassiosira oceanica]|mmetsp:Transcript_21811/g.51416  ORF Transcript_21811/g.51416 Transcript_21811/m.51416 type:complete len:308 (-) Transcript_21811:818-1741(-)|eukprot:EJK74280.1 hypothetical protein THAOC_04051 [Thalassiosira oceanica]